MKIFFNPYPRTFLIASRGGAGGERNIYRLPPICVPTGYRTCNPGIYPDQESSLQTFGAQYDAPINQATLAMANFPEIYCYSPWGILYTSNKNRPWSLAFHWLRCQQWFGLLTTNHPTSDFSRMYRNLTATYTYVFIKKFPSTVHYTKWWDPLTNYKSGTIKESGLCTTSAQRSKL